MSRNKSKDKSKYARQISSPVPSQSLIEKTNDLPIINGKEEYRSSSSSNPNSNTFQRTGISDTSIFAPVPKPKTENFKLIDISSSPLSYSVQSFDSHQSGSYTGSHIDHELAESISPYLSQDITDSTEVLNVVQVPIVKGSVVLNQRSSNIANQEIPQIHVTDEETPLTAGINFSDFEIDLNEETLHDTNSYYEESLKRTISRERSLEQLSGTQDNLLADSLAVDSSSKRPNPSSLSYSGKSNKSRAKFNHKRDWSLSTIHDNSSNSSGSEGANKKKKVLDSPTEAEEQIVEGVKSLSETQDRCLETEKNIKERKVDSPTFLQRHFSFKSISKNSDEIGHERVGKRGNIGISSINFNSSFSTLRESRASYYDINQIPITFIDDELMNQELKTNQIIYDIPPILLNNEKSTPDKPHFILSRTDNDLFPGSNNDLETITEINTRISNPSLIKYKKSIFNHNFKEIKPIKNHIDTFITNPANEKVFKLQSPVSEQRVSSEMNALPISQDPHDTFQFIDFEKEDGAGEQKTNKNNDDTARTSPTRSIIPTSTLEKHYKQFFDPIGYVEDIKTVYFVMVMIAGLLIPPIYLFVSIGMFDSWRGCFSMKQKFFSFIWGCIYCAAIFLAVGLSIGLTVR